MRCRQRIAANKIFTEYDANVIVKENVNVLNDRTDEIPLKKHVY